MALKHRQQSNPSIKIVWIIFSASKTNQSPLVGRHPFSTYTQILSNHLKTAWISSPMCWQKSNSSHAKVILLQNYSITSGKVPALTIFRFNMVLPS